MVYVCSVVLACMHKSMAEFAFDMLVCLDFWVSLLLTTHPSSRSPPNRTFTCPYITHALVKFYFSVVLLPLAHQLKIQDISCKRGLHHQLPSYAKGQVHSAKPGLRRKASELATRAPPENAARAYALASYATAISGRRFRVRVWCFPGKRELGRHDRIVDKSMTVSDNAT